MIALESSQRRDHSQRSESRWSPRGGCNRKFTRATTYKGLFEGAFESLEQGLRDLLGSMAAACECEVDGNIPVTPENVHSKIDSVERQANYNENRPPR